MIISTKRARISANSLNTRNSWIALFDQQTPRKIKGEIEKKLIDEVEEKSLRPTENIEVNYLSEPPKDAISAIIMAAGYYPGTDIFSYLRADSISTRFIFMGYSSGMHSTDKTFSDRSPMCGKLYITEEHIKVIAENISAPIIFLDAVIDTGLTVAAIGNSLRNSGYNGKLYQASETHESITSNNTKRIVNLAEWSGEIKATDVIASLANGVTIATEHGDIPKYAKFSRRN